MSSSPSAEKQPWNKTTYQRFSVDIHIPDWHSGLLARFDPVEYVDCMARAGVKSLLHYTKSHVGLCLWQTKVGGRMHAAMGEKDWFGEVVAECRRRGIHPIAYFSIIFDNIQFEEHPEWRITTAAGPVGQMQGRYGHVCPNSPYRDYAKACVREIASTYDIDGMFFDMTFWPAICYCVHCTERFRRECGAEPPRIVDWNDDTWRAFQAARQRWLLEFAHLCTDTAKGARPGITVNHQFATVLQDWKWGVPLELTGACDFVGGDFYGGAAFHSLACKTYQSLTRSFPFEFHTSRTRHYTDHVTVKPFEEIRTEAFVATLHSAALMLVDYINADGTLNGEVYEFLGRLGRERAAYEPFLGGELEADVAIYLDKESLYDPEQQGVPVTAGGADANPHGEGIVGWTRILQQRHIPFGVVTNITLEQLSRYRTVVLPHVIEMTEPQAAVFREFVRAGGTLLATGPTSLNPRVAGGPRFLLEDVFGVSYRGRLGEKIVYFSPHDPELARAVWPQDHVSFHGAACEATATPSAEVLATLTLPFVDPGLGACIGSRFAAIHSDPPMFQPGTTPGVTLHSFGQGKALWVAAPLEKRPEHVNDAFLTNLLRRLLPSSLKFEMDAPPCVEAVLFHQAGQSRLLFGLLNLQNQWPQAQVSASVVVAVPSGRKFQSVQRLPDCSDIAFESDSVGARWEVPPFESLAMFVLNYE